jgi:hypothetical protein
LTASDFVIGQVALADLTSPMAFEDEDLAADGRKSFGDGERVGAGFNDQHVVLGRMARCPGTQPIEGLASHAVDDASFERIAPMEDRGRKRIGMNVEADHPAVGAERWRSIDGLLW